MYMRVYIYIYIYICVSGPRAVLRNDSRFFVRRGGARGGAGYA